MDGSDEFEMIYYSHVEMSGWKLEKIKTGILLLDV